jgi:putative flippase GtrA
MMGMGFTRGTAGTADTVVAESVRQQVGPGAEASVRNRGAAAAFLRFVLCGGGVSLLASAVLLMVAGRMPFAAANAVVTAASTLLATELHHRFTFGTGGGAGCAGWRLHSKSALTVLVAYLFTTSAVLLLDLLHPRPSPLLAQGVYLAASGLAGTGRFLVLRLVVFAGLPVRRTAPALHRGKIAVAA